MSKIKHSLMEELGKQLHFKSVTSDKFNSVVIFLNRVVYFKHILTSIHTKTTSYGKYGGHNKEILLYNHRLGPSVEIDFCKSEQQNIVCVTLDTLRSLLLAEHINLLLKANGYKVRHIIPEDCLEMIGDFCDKLGIDTGSFVKAGITQKDTESRLRNIQSHRAVLTKHRQLLKDDGDQKSSDNIPNNCDILEFDAKSFLSEQQLQDSKNCYNKNLNTITLLEDGEPTHVLKEAVRLQRNLQESNHVQIIHISEQSLSFTSQKIDLVIKLLTDLYQQFHFVHGKVTKSKDSHTSEDMSADSYLQLRYQQMKEAAIMKYGDSVQGEGWDHTLKYLTTACVKFELLSNTPRNTVKLKLESNEDKSIENSLQGSFVMYNCARLATLFNHFEEGVKNGTYPQLPSIDEIDFSLLREEEEWVLLFNYLYPYPDIIRETVTEIESNESMFVSLHTHKICQMLIGLSRAVSSYYSRYHVLGESRPHLLPTMYARLYLLKAVHQIMVNSLTLLGITPLTQL